MIPHSGTQRFRMCNFAMFYKRNGRFSSSFVHPPIPSNSLCFTSEFEGSFLFGAPPKVFKFARFYKRIGWNLDCPQFVKFDWFYKRIRRLDARESNHVSNQNSIGFISELDELSMLPNSLNSIGFISGFDELATHSYRFVNSLNSLCFTSEMEGFTIPAIR